VLQNADTTGHFITSRALQGVVQGLALADAWNQVPRRPSFTHHSPTSATRIDRFYVSEDFAERKTGIATRPAAFTDHDAVVLRLPLSNMEPRIRRGRWKMDPQLVTEDRIRDKLRLEMAKWQRSKSYYPGAVTWWNRCVKAHLRRLIRREEVERRAQHRHMGNHL
jgi:hypothetical protein